MSFPEQLQEENPPTWDEILDGLARTGDYLIADFERLQSHLDRIAPVRATCTITETPPGPAPEAIRRQWIGVTLPIRSYLEPHVGVEVLAREAIELLKPYSPIGYAWWRTHYIDMAKEEMPYVRSEEFPEFIANTRLLVFDFYSGDGYRLA